MKYRKIWRAWHLTGTNEDKECIQNFGQKNLLQNTHFDDWKGNERTVLSWIAKARYDNEAMLELAQNYVQKQTLVPA